MKIEFTNRAVRDLYEISAQSRQQFGSRVTAALETRIQDIVTQIAKDPESGPRVQQRPGMRVVPLVRYPFKIFYRIVADTVTILHIRHTARRSRIESSD
jgi:plasmid stabilization system protein ParE